MACMAARLGESVLRDRRRVVDFLFVRQADLTFLEAAIE